MIEIVTATEDEISEAVAVRLVEDIVPEGTILRCLRKGGNGYLRSSLDKFRQLARQHRILLMTDLDRANCAPSLIQDWIAKNPLPENLMLRVAVREVEAWLLADRPGIALLMGLSEAGLPSDPDQLTDPKRALLHVARRANRTVRSELLPSRGSMAIQGLGYNRVLTDFVKTSWDIDRASQRSPSLRRTVQRLAELS